MALTYIKKIMVALVALSIFNQASAQDSKPTEQWRALDPNNTVLLIMPQGKVVIELAPQFSPKHVAQFKKLVKAGHYDGTSFYRVIDGFVAQGGPGQDSAKGRAVPNLSIEGEWHTANDWSFTLVQKDDLFAPQTGFKDGFALGHDPQEQKAWLTHCPGVIAMARENLPNTATSHFYFTIGQAPRYLDRIMTIFGRVVYGMHHVQAIQRTSVIEGEEKVNAQSFTPMLRMKLMADVAKEEQIHIEVEQTESAHYQQSLVKRLKRESAFFYQKPPQVLDVCQTPVRSRLVSKAK